MTLEPTWRIVFLVVLAHAAALGGGWWWMTHPPAQPANSATPEPRWFSPKNIATPSAQPVSPEMLPHQSSGTVPVIEAPPGALITPSPPVVIFSGPRFEVTLSHKAMNQAQPTSAPGADMTGVDQAIVDEFKLNWVLPADLDTGGTAREALMDVVIARDGRIMNYMIVSPSGNSKVDMSVLRAAGLLKRIPMPLPPQFSGDSYEVQIHCRAQ